MSHSLPVLTWTLYFFFTLQRKLCYYNSWNATTSSAVMQIQAVISHKLSHFSMLTLN